MPELSQIYGVKRKTILLQVVDPLIQQVKEALCESVPYESISARAKTVDSFIEKAATIKDGKLKYENPLEEIQDQIGVRVVVFHKRDVDPVSRIIGKYFREYEKELIVPDTDKEFGYFGMHHILSINHDHIPNEIESELIPPFFELQIKTLYEHAWSQAEHGLGYKCNRELSSEEKRIIAFLSAQSWGADWALERLLIERDNHSV